jgi:NAD(P)H-flavin reductase
MIKPERTSAFLGRPISVEDWDSQKIRFLIAVRGKGTAAIAGMTQGEKADLTGPLGNAWEDMPFSGGPIALVSGGVGVAPLTMFAKSGISETIDVYAGFTSAPFGYIMEEKRKTLIASEEGGYGRLGRILDFFEPQKYRAVYACGPEAMLKAASAQCKQAGVPCFISLERTMACGTGACLGCTVKTNRGNRRCCTDGPIFNAEEVMFDE